MTKRALWPERWPLIAHHVLDTGKTCVDTIEEAEPEEREAVRFALPCDECPESTRCQNAKRKELGSLLFDREELTKPRASESSLFPFELFEPDLLYDRPLLPYYLKPFGVEDEEAVASAWDLAWSEKAGSDYLVRMTGRVNRLTGKRTLMDIYRDNRIPFPQQCSKIESDWEDRFHDDIVVIESDAAQQVWSQHMKATTRVPVMPHDSSAKRDFKLGVPGLLIKLETHQWEFPYVAGGYHHENMTQFLAEAEAFGWNDDKLEGVGEHDDTVMAFWHLDWILTLLNTPPKRGRPPVGSRTGREI